MFTPKTSALAVLSATPYKQKSNIDRHEIERIEESGVDYAPKNERGHKGFFDLLDTQNIRINGEPYSRTGIVAKRYSRNNESTKRAIVGVMVFSRIFDVLYVDHVKVASDDGSLFPGEITQFLLESLKNYANKLRRNNQQIKTIEVLFQERAPLQIPNFYKAEGFKAKIYEPIPGTGIIGTHYQMIFEPPDS